MVSWGKLERRHDARFYLPHFVRLEEKVRLRTNRKLRDFCLAMASGATPKAEEKELYYSDNPETGIPFIRVQNLNMNGDLDTNDVKLINESTHNGMLARSHVQENDLLVKITGVGRMAVSSVPPVSFVGNINQHIARAKTRSRLESRALAAFLNTDIGEALATRRATGGTRPALDYPALRSIPIIYNEAILSVLDNGNSRRKVALDKAGALLASIDDYLLSELGIVLPAELENTIGNRMFRTNAHELGGWRFDPLFHSFKLWHAIEASPTPSGHLGTYCRLAKTGFAAGGDMQLHDDDGIIQIRPTNIGADRQLKFDRNVYLDRSILTQRPTDVLNRREVLFNNTNSQEQVGKTSFFDIEGPFVCSNHITRILTNEAVLVPEYLTAVLNTYQRLKVFYSICTNWNNQSGVNVDLLRKLAIPVPSVEKQQLIAGEISKIFDQANSLRQEANAELDKAKAEIEAILLGDAA
ncbi:restriction endonuclease subunit S [Yoonia sp. F2084L]|uniref:restriction endonuclease subunit S n=1 Tax=Yoonia sp. F2084L TaxID=2926419 RepID=UPI001FF37E6F|nr:restriction endonuclease subunit S [Yoonia sp. F2084L]MCK0096701.1 restriction endonuclease subunit S [Yoonia sp. F2084L]